MFTFKWIFVRFLVPILLATAGIAVHPLIPKGFVADTTPAVVPMLLVLFQIIVSRTERAKIATATPTREVDIALRNWKALDLPARVLAAMYEVIIITDVARHGLRIQQLLITLFFFGLYVVLSIFARICLLRAYELIAEDILQ